MNKVLLLGRLTKDPELKTGNNGNDYCNFSVAVNEGKDKSGAAIVNYFNATAFGKTAVAISTYFHKGDQILIEGRLKNDNYEKDGKKVYRDKLICDRFFFGQRKSGDGDKTDAPVFTEMEDSDPADLPF